MQNQSLKSFSNKTQFYSRCMTQDMGFFTLYIYIYTPNNFCIIIIYCTAINTLAQLKIPSESPGGAGGWVLTNMSRHYFLL